MAQRTKFPPEVRQRAVLMVFAHRNQYGSQSEAIRSIAATVNVSAGTLRTWVREAERDVGPQPGALPAEQEWINELESKNQELQIANAILKAASFFLVREFGHRLPRL